MACPVDSNSYGASFACRALSPSAVGQQYVVSPDFQTSLANLTNLGSVGSSGSFNFTISNASTDLPMPNILTSLGLLGAQISVGGVAFSLSPLPALLNGNTSQVFTLSWSGLTAGAFAFTVDFLTDQFADPGQQGQTFSFAFTGNNASVPEPTTWLTLLSGLLGLGAWQRRRRAAQRS
jgi:MYXO-CTERM domain-containing protein